MCGLDLFSVIFQDSYFNKATPLIIIFENEKKGGCIIIKIIEHIILFIIIHTWCHKNKHSPERIIFNFCVQPCISIYTDSSFKVSVYSNEKARNNSIWMFPNIFFSIIALYVSIVYIMEDIYACEHFLLVVGYAAIVILCRVASKHTT